MADLRNSSEIVTQKELEPVLNSSRFDSVTFLRLYNEWKVTKDAGTFSALRKMHEDAGYNNKNIIIGAEQEMHEIAAIVQKYQDSKNVVTTTAATAASGVRQSVPSAPVPTQEITEESIRKQSGDIRKSLDVMTMQNLESSLKLTESLAKMIPSTHTTIGRGVIGSMMLGRLQELGYSLSVDANNNVLIRSEKKDVLEVKNKINAFVAVPGSAMLDIIKTGTLYMSPTFREYAASNMIDGKIVVEKTPADYSKYLEFKRGENPKKDPIVSDLNFIDSFKGGGYNGFNFTQAMVQSQGLGKVAQFIDSNPAIAEKIATTVAPAVNPGTLPATSRSSPSQRPSTTAGKAAGVVGEGVGAVAGGIGAVVGNVASETASTWSTILSEATKSGGAFGTIGVIGLIIASIWKFGFGKTLMGIIGVGGASAIANAAENGTFDKFADKLKKGAKVAGEAAEEALDSGKAAVASGSAALGEATKSEKPQEKETTLTPSQQLAQKEVMKESSKFNAMIQSHAKAIPNQSATLDEYVNFLHSSEFQNQKLDNILYSQNAKASIFQNEKNWDLSIHIPGTMDSVILKKIFRQYLTGSYVLDTAPQGSQEGDKEKSAFEKKYSLSEKDKNKSIKDILPNIYK